MKEYLTHLNGQKISEIVLVKGNNELRITFDSGVEVRAWDGGQCCCEQRYMTTDDDLSEYEGATFLGMELRDAPDIDEGYGIYHEVQFLVVKTDRGNVSFANHNEHNGYYGGFSLEFREEEEVMNAYAMKQNALDDALLDAIQKGVLRFKRVDGQLVRFDLLPLTLNDVTRLELMISNGKLKECEECQELIPTPCYLAGIQRELCENCAADHGSEDWK